MNEIELPEIPCNFSGSSSAVLWFREDKLTIKYCQYSGRTFVVKAEALYTSIKYVFVTPSPRLFGMRLYDSFLTLRRTEHDYYPVGLEPLGIPLSNFRQQQWPVILNLVCDCAPQAQFDEWAIKIMNAHNEKEIRELKI